MKTYSLCLISGTDLFKEIISLKYALKPFILYKSSYFVLLYFLKSKTTGTPCSPMPEIERAQREYWLHSLIIRAALKNELFFSSNFKPNEKNYCSINIEGLYDSSDYEYEL